MPVGELKWVKQRNKPAFHASGLGWKMNDLPWSGTVKGAPLSRVGPWRKGGTQGDFIFWKMSLCSWGTYRNIDFHVFSNFHFSFGCSHMQLHQSNSEVIYIVKTSLLSELLPHPQHGSETNPARLTGHRKRQYHGCLLLCAHQVL